MKPIELVMDTECKPKLSFALEPMQRQNIRKSIPTAEQLADLEDVFALVWRTHRAMSKLGLSEVTVRHYTDDGLAVILNRHYDTGTDRYSDEILDRLVSERRFRYEQGQITRVPYQNLRKSAYWIREMHRTGDITLGKIPNWGQREPVELFQTLLDEFCVSAEQTMAETSLKVARSAVRYFLIEVEDHGFSSLGYSSIEATHKYMVADLDLKRKAMELAGDCGNKAYSYKPSKEILEFLKSL